uniref:Uncharacterized protein n=1 Tax=Salix viminalis TaxID=40686 RepID=A0A6N2KPN5_SALVM
MTMKRKSGGGGLTITWFMSCLQTYIAILQRLLNPLNISQTMVILALQKESQSSMLELLQCILCPRI